MFLPPNSGAQVPLLLLVPAVFGAACLLNGLLLRALRAALVRAASQRGLAQRSTAVRRHAKACALACATLLLLRRARPGRPTDAMGVLLF